jgi:hypothetical protein
MVEHARASLRRVLPVPNAVLARYYDSPPVVLFYAASLIATSISNAPVVVRDGKSTAHHR